MNPSSSDIRRIVQSGGGPDDRRVGAPPSLTGRRIAVQGLGLMGARHVEAARRAGHAVVAVVDPNAEAHALKQDAGLRGVHHAALAEVDPSSVDVLVIATTADLHHRLACEAIALGFSRIVIEKPVTQSVAQAVDIRLRAEAAGARIVVNHGRRYCEAYSRLRRSKAAFNLGEVRSVTMRFGGGSLGCVGTHWIDLATAIVDARAVSVFATETTPAANPRGARFVDPGASLMIVFENGAVAYIDTRDDVGFLGGLSVSFSRGEVSWRDEFGPWSLRRRAPADFDQPLTRYGLPLTETTMLPSEAARGGTGPWPYAGANAILSYVASAIDDALSDDPPVSGIGAAIETMRVYAGLVESARSGRSVVLDALDDGVLARLHAIP